MNGAPPGGWVPLLDRSAGPLYQVIAGAIAADIAAGRLPDGARLPPQRALADRLGIDFTTVSRAYAEAARRGLVRSRVGQGTFVTAAAPAASHDLPGAAAVDMSMNLPPRLQDAVLRHRLWSGFAALEKAGGLDLLQRYQEPGGGTADRIAAAWWLAPRLPNVGRDRLLVCPGTQAALLATVTTLAKPGDTILTEALTYPGFRSLAGQFHFRLAGVAMDGEGLLPDALDEACRRERPKALYCTPTLHNPTTATMSLARREAIVAVARRHALPIIEDDAYGALPRQSLPPLAALAPELGYHVAGLSKALSPALRIAYLVVPDARVAQRVANGIRAASGMASPLTAAAATRWIEDGTAAAVLEAIRAETAARRALVAHHLPAVNAACHPESFHLWLHLPPGWARGIFAARLHAAGIGVVMSDDFALSDPPEAVRIGLGAAGPGEALDRGLASIADLLDQPPALSAMVV